MTFDKGRKEEETRSLIDEFDSSFYGEHEDEEIDLRRLEYTTGKDQRSEVQGIQRTQFCNGRFRGACLLEGGEDL